MKPDLLNSFSTPINLIALMLILFTSYMECTAKPVPDSTAEFGYHALKINNRFVDQEIFPEEKNRFFMRYHANPEMMYKGEEERMNLVLENIIDRVVLENFLQNQSGITIPAQQIDNYINLYFKPKYPSPKEFDSYLHNEGYKNETDLRRNIELHLLKRTYFVKLAKEAGMTIPPQELDSLYRTHVDENRFVVIRHILIENLDSIKAQQLATDLYNQCKNGADFDSMATQYSSDTAARSAGGQSSVMSRAGFDPSFADTVFAAQPGDLLPPVKTGLRYLIVKVERFISTSHPKDEFTDMLLLKMFGDSELYRKWITEVKSKTPISIIDPAFKAYRLYSNGNYDKAGVLYEKLFRRSHDEFYLKRAIDCFEKAGKADKVFRLAQNGITIYPENLTYPLIKAEYLYNKGKTNDAIALLHDIELRARGSVYFTDLLEKTRAKLGINK